MCRWSAIAAQLPGRTDNEIKNHWHTSLKKRLKRNSITNANGAKDTPKRKDPEIYNHDDTEANPVQESNLVDIIPPILESSSSSSDRISSLSMTTDITSVGKNTNTTDELILDNNNEVVFHPYADTSGSFWTEPFYSDNFYNLYISNDFQAPSLLPADPGFASVHSPFLDGEIILWP